MKEKLCIAILCLISFNAIAQQINVKDIHAKRIEITSAFDSDIEAEIQHIITTYKGKVDSVMQPPLGVSLRAMSIERPESPLSNWAADVMVETSTATGLPKADMGLFNMGGLRSTMPHGGIRVGDVYKISPFENNVVVLEMKGKHVIELMQNIASVGGEGVSASVRMVISKTGELLSATLNGEPINKKKIYRIATIDYLAEGNDNMVALKKHRKKHPMQRIAREAMMESIIKSRTIDSKIEGRIVIK